MTGWDGISPPMDTAPLTAGTDMGAVLDDTLALLQEARAYLKRLPQVHPTMLLIAKLDRHLHAPATATAQRVAAQIEHEKHARFATAKDPFGVPIIEAEVQGDKVRLKFGPLRNKDRAINLMQAGCELQLTPKQDQRRR